MQRSSYPQIEDQIAPRGSNGHFRTRQEVLSASGAMSTEGVFIGCSVLTNEPFEAERETLLKELSILNCRRATRLAVHVGEDREIMQTENYFNPESAHVRPATATEQYTAGRQARPRRSIFDRVITSGGFGISQPLQGVEAQQEPKAIEHRSAARASGQVQTPNKQCASAVYMRRYRQRQKELVLQLEQTLQQRMQQLQQLQAEHHELLRKDQAMQQVLSEQNRVLQMLTSSSHDCSDSLQDDERWLQPLPPATAVPQSQTSAGVTVATETPSSSMSVLQGSDDTGSATEMLASAVAASVADAVQSMQSKQQPMDGPQQLRQQAILALLTRQWLEPIKYYVLQSASWLAMTGKLPSTSAAEAAVEAGARCSAAYDLKQNMSEVARAVKDAVSSSAADQFGTSAATAARLVSTAVRSAWMTDEQPHLHDSLVMQDSEKSPPVSFPYAPSAYVMVPDHVKDLALPMNMDTWQIDDGNSKEHMELAARALWQSLTPDQWHLLHDTWLAMGQQLNQVQEDLHTVRGKLRSMAGEHKISSSHEKTFGESMEGFATMEASRSYEYAAAAVEVERLLIREHAIAHQVCGATLRMLTAEQVAVAFVACWPYHPHVFTMFDFIFKLGEPPV